MSDQHADTSPDRGQNAPSHASSELVPSGDDRCQPQGDHFEPHSSKDIVLQCLTPQSSWDRAFGDPEPFAKRPFDERVFEDAPRESAAPAPDRARTTPPLAAMIAMAAVVGAISGGAATFGVPHFFRDDRVATAMAERGRSIDDAIAKINAEIAAVKANVDTSTKTNSARLAKLSETLDKLRTPAPEITGSIPASPAPSTAPPAAQFGRLPIVEGWVLREVADGGALIEGRQGVYEVFAGDPLPGVGRIEAIRRQDGRWVVVTTRGLIVAR